MSSALAISTTGLKRRFSDNEAVAGVDLAIASGEVYGFLGPNGAGKSTVVRMLCTLLLPSDGVALVAGYDVAQSPEQVRLRIGAALQDAALDPKQTGRELLRLQGRLYGLRGNLLKRRIDHLAGLVDIGAALDDRIGTYSGGMKRRLDLAAALVHDPEILFLDEPTTGLDPISRARVWEEVEDLNKRVGMTIFLTTQYLEEADALAGRVGIISAGRIVAEDTPEALKRSVGSDVVTAHVQGDATRAVEAVRSVPGVDSVDLAGDELVVHAGDGATILSPVAVALAGCGVQVKALTLRTPTLDDVFLQLTGGRLEDERQEATA